MPLNPTRILYQSTPVIIRASISARHSVPAVAKITIKEGLSSMTRRASVAGEVIYDSEPEREERRRREKEERKIKRLQIQDKYGSGGLDFVVKPTSPPPFRSAIRLDPDAPSKIDGESNSVIDISDDDDVQSQEQPKSTLEPPSSVFGPSVPAGPSNPLVPNIISSDSEVEPEEDNHLHLSRFAYQKPSRSQSRNTLSRTSSVAVLVDNPQVKPVAPQKASRTTRSHRFAADFTNAELKKMVVCVCCGDRWTSRKGVEQKMLHVQTCAKKKAFTDQTIKILIRQEIDKVPDENPRSKGKGKAPEPENVLSETPRTLMDDVVREAEPKKKGRRANATITVKPVAEIHGIIRDKFRSVLGDHALPNIEDGTDHRNIQAFGRSGLAMGQLEQDTDGWNVPSSTQAFGKSTLAQKLVSNRNMTMSTVVTQNEPLVDPESSRGEDLVPTATQSFAPSKLAGLHCPSRPGVGDEHNTEMIVSEELSRISPSSHLASPSSYIDLVSSSSRDPSPHLLLRMNAENVDCERILPSTPPPHILSSPLPPTLNSYSPMNRSSDGTNFSDHIFEWENDDAFLHFDPLLRDRKPHSPYISEDRVIYLEESDEGQCTYEKATEAGQKQKTKTRRTTPERSDIPSTPNKTKKPTRAQGKKRAAENEGRPLDAEWEAALKASIVRDERLHLRILRYEPIHFEVFLQKTTNAERPSGRLKTALRSFLDRQAINFYGHEQNSGRGRR